MAESEDAAAGVAASFTPNDAMLDFALTVQLADLPDDVVAFARRCLLDIVGVAAAGSMTPLAAKISDHAAAHFGATPGHPAARIIFDDTRQTNGKARAVSPPGAALAGGMTIDSIDAHDGHKLTKGHSGCSSVPAVLALADAHGITDEAEVLTLIVIGYEVSTRAGIALHSTTPDYHTSGAWGAVACAAIGARALGLTMEQAREAIGIAEYHGPRSQMMRVIDHPSMLKDGSGWGAMAGLSAAYLAADGFTGAPAISVEAAEVGELWSDLGHNWRIFEQYFKPHPVCRWAQPAVEAALQLCRDHAISSTDIDHLEVATFHEARRLDTRRPASTEEAQYSLPFPTAAAIVRGTLGVLEVTEGAFDDPEIVRLSTGTRIVEHDDFNAAFPGRRFAEVSMVLRDGRTITSEPTEPRGDPEAHLSSDEIEEKFFRLSEPVLDQQRSESLQATIAALGTPGSSNGVTGLIDLMTGGGER